MTPNTTQPAEIAARFPISGPVEDVVPLSNGLINATFLVKAPGSGWILQRVNGRVFPHPELIMENLALLSEHLAGRHASGIRIPRLVPASDGNPYVRDEEGEIWRLMELIPDAKTLAGIQTSVQAREIGRTLGHFHRLVADLDPSRVAVTLPGFHVTPGYLERFTRALNEAGRICHTEQFREAVTFVTARRNIAGVLEEAKREGRIPVRVVHGDPKLDNILFDRTGTRALGLIDLDTLQPGLIHHDIGDCLRSCCNRWGETPEAGRRAELDLGVCRDILDTYADETRDLLTADEVVLIHEAVRLIPFELGLRFLTDHLEGNRYFRVSEPEQNLRRARVQFDLVADIEGKEEDICAIVADCFRREACGA